MPEENSRKPRYSSHERFLIARFLFPYADEEDWDYLAESQVSLELPAGVDLSQLSRSVEKPVVFVDREDD